MNPILRPLFLPLVLCLLAPSALRADEPMSDAELQALLHERIDTTKHDVGIVVGLLDEKGQRIIACGKTAHDNGRDVDGRALNVNEARPKAERASGGGGGRSNSRW